jgi:hypothetical protein
VGVDYDNADVDETLIQLLAEQEAKSSIGRGAATSSPS